MAGAAAAITDSYDEYEEADDIMPEKGIKIKLVKINELRMSSYQRPTSAKQVDKIAARFDPAKAGLIIVSERDGGLYLVDGAHRVQAMRMNYLESCPAIVLMGLNEQEEADYFRKQDENKRGLSHYDRFRAGVVAGDAVCLEVSDILKRNNFRVSGNASSPFSIKAINTILNIHKRYGPDILDKTLMLIRQTWEDTADAKRGDVLVGVAEFVMRFGTAGFVERLSSVRFSLIYQK